MRFRLTTTLRFRLTTLKKKCSISPQQPDKELVILSGSSYATDMNFQKFVAWDKLPTLYPEPDKESSSSSSYTGSLEEDESDFFQKAQDSVDDLAIPSVIEIPHSVKNVLNKIDTAQLERAKKVYTETKQMPGSIYTVGRPCMYNSISAALLEQTSRPSGPASCLPQWSISSSGQPITEHRG